MEPVVISGSRKKNSPQQEIGLAQKALGQVYRPLSKADELLRGGLGSASEALLGLGNKAIEKVSGTPNVLPNQLRPNDPLQAWKGHPLQPQIEQLIGQKIPENAPPLKTMADVRKEHEEFAPKIGLNKEQLQPQNVAEELIDWTAQDLPLLLATSGGSFLSSLGKSAATGAGSLAAKKAGLGPIGQFLGGVLGGGYLEAAKKAGNPFTPVRSFAKKTKNALYKDVERIAPTISEDASALGNNLKSLYKDIEGPYSGLTREARPKVVHELDNVLGLINNGKINVNDAWKQKKHLNKIIPEFSGESERYLRSLERSLENNILQRAAQSNQEFGKAYIPANQLHVALEVPNSLRSILEYETGLKKLLYNPLAKGIVGTLGGFGLLHGGIGGLGKLAGTAAGAYAGRGLLRAYDFYKTPIGRKILGDIAQQSVEKNIPALATSFIKLNDAAEEYEKKNPPIESAVILSGRRKSK